MHHFEIQSNSTNRRTRKPTVHASTVFVDARQSAGFTIYLSSCRAIPQRQQGRRARQTPKAIVNFFPTPSKCLASKIRNPSQKFFLEAPHKKEGFEKWSCFIHNYDVKSCLRLQSFFEQAFCWDGPGICRLGREKDGSSSGCRTSTIT